MAERAPVEAFVGLLSGSASRPTWLPVLSGSMAPVLVPGDEVLVHACPWSRCRVGDVIVFRRGLSLTAHRLVLKIVFLGRALLVQQGDAMRFAGTVAPGLVVGRCVCRRRGGELRSLAVTDENRRTVARLRRGLFVHFGREFVKWIIRKRPGSLSR